MSHLLEFYGIECPHCQRVAPIVEQVEKELGVTVEKIETWHNDENAAKLRETDKGMCGGVPFFYNTKTGKFVCGAGSYEEIKAWAAGE